MPTPPPPKPTEALDVLAPPSSPIIKIVIYFSKSEWQLAFFSLQQAVNHRALITFVTSLTLWARCSAGENGTSNKGPPQPQPPSVHSKCENLSNYGFYKILLTFHLLSFSHTPPTKHPRSQQLCTPNLLAHLLKKTLDKETTLFQLSLLASPSPCRLVLTQQGLSRSKQPEVTLLSVTPSYPGRGPGSRETRSAGPRGHKAQINRDERYIWSLHRSLARAHQGQASFSAAVKSTAFSGHRSAPQRSRFSV